MVRKEKIEYVDSSVMLDKMDNVFISYKEKKMNQIKIPETYNYIGVFLTLACNLHCTYCLNKHDYLAPSFLMSGADWVKGLNRLSIQSNLPITLQGGEPTIHPDFYQIVNGVKSEINIDLLTNGQFDEREFARNIHFSRMMRNAPYASIRFSYHPEQMNFEYLLEKVGYLRWKGYSVGIWAVDHPKWSDQIRKAYELSCVADIDFRLKEFLGEYRGTKYGTYKYRDACGSVKKKDVKCRTSELLIGPSGHIYRCHSDLYAARFPIGHILEDGFFVHDVYKPCSWYGHCNPCDVKIKTNRFQEFGHISVDINFEEVDNESI